MYTSSRVFTLRTGKNIRTRGFAYPVECEIDVGAQVCSKEIQKKYTKQQKTNTGRWNLSIRMNNTGKSLLSPCLLENWCTELCYNPLAHYLYKTKHPKTSTPTTYRFPLPWRCTALLWTKPQSSMWSATQQRTTSYSFATNMIRHDKHHKQYKPCPQVYRDPRLLR